MNQHTHSPGHDAPLGDEGGAQHDRRLSSPDLADTSPFGQRLLRMEEVAELLGVSARTLRRYRARGLLRSVCFGRQVRVRESDLMTLLEPREPHRP